MSLPFGVAAQAWLKQASGLDHLVCERLPGSTSSSVFRVAGEQAGEVTQLVLRVLDNPAWLADEPDLIAHERAALLEAARAGLPAPRFVAAASEDVGFGAPVLLMSWLPGEIELRPRSMQAWLTALAQHLALIHRHPAPAFAWQFRSWVDWSIVAPPAWSTTPDLWAQAIAILEQPAPPTPSVFLHRDFHPTNVLWQGDVVSGTVDWINACRGPAGVDVAHCRVNLAKMFGPAVAAQFLVAYRAAAPEFVFNPYWEIDILCDTCLAEPLFYPPWQTFGLDLIPASMLCERIDAHLANILREPAHATGG